MNPLFTLGEEFRFHDSSRFRRKAWDAKIRFYHSFVPVLISLVAESCQSRAESVHLPAETSFTTGKELKEFQLCDSRRLRKMRKMMSLNCSICLMPVFGAGKVYRIWTPKGGPPQYGSVGMVDEDFSVFEELKPTEYDDYRFIVLSEGRGVEHYIVRKLSYLRSLPVTREIWIAIQELFAMRWSHSTRWIFRRVGHAGGMVGSPLWMGRASWKAAIRKWWRRIMEGERYVWRGHCGGQRRWSGDWWSCAGTHCHGGAWIINWHSRCTVSSRCDCRAEGQSKGKMWWKGHNSAVVKGPTSARRCRGACVKTCSRFRQNSLDTFHKRQGDKHDPLPHCPYI